MRAVKLLLAAAVVAVGAFAATSVLTNAPEDAQAHSCSNIVYHPTDQSWACASSPSGSYKACDYDVEIDTSEPSPGDGPDRISAWAPSQGCSAPEGISYGGNHILRIKVCTEGEGCSGWVRVT
jgi:hypothetical protein